MTNRVKSGIYFGVFIAVGLIAQNSITLPNYTPQQILRSFASGLMAGSIAGLLFGWLIGARWLSKLIGQKRSEHKE